jgi:hypothetical protein
MGMSSAISTSGALYRNTHIKGVRHCLFKGKLNGRLISVALPAEKRPPIE